MLHSAHKAQDLSLSRKTSCYLWELQTPPGVAVPHLQSLTQLPALHLNPVCVCALLLQQFWAPKIGIQLWSTWILQHEDSSPAAGTAARVAEFSPSAELSTQMEFVMMWKNPFK